MTPRLRALLLAAAPGLALAQAPGTSGAADPRLATPVPAAPAAAPVEEPVEKPAEEPTAPKRAVPPSAVLEEVAGTVQRVDHESHRVEIATPAGPTALKLDRNTLVYTARGLGTVLDLAPGSELRAGRNSSFVAYWIQVRAPGGTPPAAPGSGPGGGSGATGGEAGGAPGGSPGSGAPPPGSAPPDGGGGVAPGSGGTAGGSTP